MPFDSPHGSSADPYLLFNINKTTAFMSFRLFECSYSLQVIVVWEGKVFDIPRFCLNLNVCQSFNPNIQT